MHNLSSGQSNADIHRGREETQRSMWYIEILHKVRNELSLYSRAVCSRAHVCVCVQKPARAGARPCYTDGAPRSRTANYDSSGMSPELSAKMEIKRPVSGPTASQSDSHVNNIGGICCNLGIIYPPLPNRRKEKLTICPLKVEMSI